ncbi:MAG TPA: response regulator transcription factor [Streptosporangiaceae bacterium]|nr:response regulator transcription factor [Streptosporangiaceae bacterium]
MRLVLCDKNRILCEALGAAMESRGHQVVAIATTAADGVAAAAEFRPDVVLLDLAFPDGASTNGATAVAALDADADAVGVGAARAIRREHPGTAVLVLSSMTDAAAWSAALDIGVAGLLRKDQCVNAIADALDVIAAGGVVLDQRLTRQSNRRPARRRTGSLYVLTPREKEVLRRIVAGQSTGQMACEMNIATSTLRTYVKNVLSKIGAHTRLQAAALASQGDLQNELSA